MTDLPSATIAPSAIVAAAEAARNRVEALIGTVAETVAAQAVDAVLTAMPGASATGPGTMSAADKVKLDGLDAALALKADAASLGNAATLNVGTTAGTVATGNHTHGTIATQNANAVAITGGSINGATIGATTKAPAVYAGLFATDAAAAQTQINYNNGPDSVAKSSLWIRSRAFGTVTGPETASPANVAPNKILFADAANSPSSSVNALEVTHTLSGGTTGDEGTRQAFESRMQVVGQSGTTGYQASVAVSGIGYSTTTQGGPGGWTTTAPSTPDAYYRGGMFGANFNTWLGAGASNYRGISGAEINWAVRATASTAAKAGLALILSDNDEVRGEINDSALKISKKFGVVGTIKSGIEFGDLLSAWPFTTDSTLIGAVRRGDGISAVGAPEATVAALHGVDFSKVTFGGSAFRSPGFTVDGNGAVSQRPAASATPANNGDMVFELTSNTSLKIKVKGGDGVVRSATLTLA